MTGAACLGCQWWGGGANNLQAPCRAHEAVGMTHSAIYQRGASGAVARPELAGEVQPGVRYVLVTSRNFACQAFAPSTARAEGAPGAAQGAPPGGAEGRKF